MSSHRIRIFSSLLIAFIIVNIYGNLTGIKNAISNIKLDPSGLKKLLSLNIKFPESNELKPLTKYNGNVNYKQISPSPAVVLTKAGPTNVPTKYIIPTTITKGSGYPTPTNRLNPTRPIQPTLTTRPKPTVTKYIKPTKIPPPPPITSDLRPGTILTEIFQEVGKRTCFPPALLRAIQEKETGAWWSFNSPSSKVKIYNTYGWWITGAGNPCTGFGYHTQTGIVPQDSVNAGYSCQNSVGASGDIGVMGLLQVSFEEQTLTRKYTLATLPKSIDRRVVFDNALIFAIATKNRIGTTPKSCDDWPDDVILTAAESHIGRGSCSAQNYCNDVLKLYKQYR